MVSMIFSGYSFAQTSYTGAVGLGIDFGDGATDSIANPAHFYNSNDTFIVSLTVTNGCGSSTATDKIGRASCRERV